ncbi:MAG TPA: metallophosphoesterase [Balneolales bacterium]|nr:metallophosphoesterase [Balneolales bacterium]
MRIGIISDTHDHVQHIEKAVKIFKNEEIPLVIHAGDYCSPFAILPFEGLNLVGVFGNNDGDHYRLIDKFNAIDGNMAGEFYEFEEDGCKFAVYHGTQQAIKDALVKCGTYDVVISGHTHEKVMEKVGKTISINPGTANGFGGEASIVIFDTQTRKAEFIDL